MFKFRAIHYILYSIMGFLGVLFGFSLFHNQYPVKALSLINSPEQMEWITISDENHGYNFQVPSNWYSQMGVTPDRWLFLSDPQVVNSSFVHPPPMPQGLIKIDFGVEPVANLLPELEERNAFVDERGNATGEDLVPFLPEGTWVQIDGMPALIVDYTRQQLEAGHGGEFVEATAVYILAERTVYYFWIAYAPPPVDEYNTAKSNYLMIKSHILESFTADLE